jgi:hypothetical protein
MIFLPFTYAKFFSHGKMQLLVTAKSDQDPHWFGSLDSNLNPHFGFESWIRIQIEAMGDQKHCSQELSAIFDKTKSYNLFFNKMFHKKLGLDPFSNRVRNQRIWIRNTWQLWYASDNR